ncbi:hypothetical protein [Bifidobacterium scaligerum]|uniref:hypothetical protein n=1 Tax=Bifidobacterium scaligerum TaxID=2052656 RepID=UPI0010550074|nr:hypothetical protein [Bifidobacterium scaligerum]
MTCEVVTNAIRHGRDLHRIVIAWDHSTNGTLAVMTRNDGSVQNDLATRNGNQNGTGMGLDRLKRMVTDAGGSFETGPDGMDYTLKAYSKPPSVFREP